MARICDIFNEFLSSLQARSTGYALSVTEESGFEPPCYSLQLPPAQSCNFWPSRGIGITLPLLPSVGLLTLKIEENRSVAVGSLQRSSKPLVEGRGLADSRPHPRYQWRHPRICHQERQKDTSVICHVYKITRNIHTRCFIN